MPVFVPDGELVKTCASVKAFFLWLASIFYTKRRGAQSRAGKEHLSLEKALAKKEFLVDAEGKTKMTAKSKTKLRTRKQNLKLKMTPEELKALRVELMTKAHAAKKAKRGK